MRQGKLRFGQYLVKAGLITPFDIVQALGLQRVRQHPFGKICLNTGKLSVAQVFEILNLQSTHDLFGEVCVELGYLTPDDVELVLQMQRESRPPIGELLVELGAIEADKLDGLISRFEKERLVAAS